MSLSAFQAYFHGILARVPWWHWAMICFMALTVFLLIRKKSSVYGAIALGMTVFIGLLLLDTAVMIRYLGLQHHVAGCNLKVDLTQLFHGENRRKIEIVSNAAVFIPFGFFLSESLSSLRRIGPWRQIGLVTLASFCLSLCIELLQLVLHIGFFEVADLVLNTVGGVVGVVLTLAGRRIFRVNRK